MVVVKRQTSNPGTQSTNLGSYTVNYGGFDSPRANPYANHNKSDRSYFHDVEGKSKIPELHQSNSLKKQKKGKKSIPVRYMLNLIQYLVFGFLLMKTWSARSELEITNTELSMMNKDYGHIKGLLQDTEVELKQAHDDFLKLQVRVNTMTPYPDIHRGITKSSERKVLTDTIIDRHTAQHNRIKAMQKTIQDIHKQELIRMYGPGPYEIEVAVRIEGEQKFFTIQTAPIDIMPHAIHTFMDSVVNGVWDDTMFIHKVQHVVLATPIDEKGNQKSPELTKKLLFPEYSEKFPHVEHTIGYQGRPGGPEIYINLDDNSAHHGPGGQKQHDLVEEADPCFGKITHGIEVLTKFIELNAKAVQNNDISYSKIEYMKFMKKI